MTWRSFVIFQIIHRTKYENKKAIKNRFGWLMIRNRFFMPRLSYLHLSRVIPNIHNIIKKDTPLYNHNGVHNIFVYGHNLRIPRFCSFFINAFRIQFRDHRWSCSIRFVFTNKQVEIITRIESSLCFFEFDLKMMCSSI